MTRIGRQRSPGTGSVTGALNSLLLTDLYQLNMMQAYFDRGMDGTAVFEFFVRRLPERRGFLVAAGLEQALEFLDGLGFDGEELEWLASTGRFTKAFLDDLAGLRFTGDVDAMPEGTVFFADEPILRVVAPLPVAQLVETRLVNLLNFESLIASKAARMRLAAGDKRLIDFGLRRAHGGEAGLLAARAAYIGGFDGTATVLADHAFGIPIYGTMAHSFVQAFDDETEAFEAFARSRPEGLVLLVDTYDTEAGVRKVVELAPRLAADGITVTAVRLDSGDLAELAKRARRILDEAGLENVAVFASGGLDEEQIATLIGAGAPIVGFGVGTSLTTSSDVPAFDSAYKLEEYDGKARRKRSEGKATWPGRKQVWRRCDRRDRMSGDVLTLEGDPQEGEALLRPVMRAGRRVGDAETLADSRARCTQGIARLPDGLRALEPATAYPVRVAPALERLAAEVDRRIAETVPSIQA